MRDGVPIVFLKRKDIDTRKWDACIAAADNRLIYGMSYFLDIMTDHWDGLVLGDYQAVMPLPWRRKWGVSYLYYPFLAAQLGLFGKAVDGVLLSRFLDKIPPVFRYRDFPLNYGNCFNLRDRHLYIRSNFILDLQAPYEALYRGYRENVRRNIRKAYQYGCFIQKAASLDEIIALSRSAYPETPAAGYEKFSKLYAYMLQQGAAETYGVYSKTNELVSGCAFVQACGRSTYILVGNHPNGRTLGASHALIDAFIKDRAGSKVLLDFEGSDIRNLAFFYAGFGAQEEKYPALRENRLPWYLKWVKE